MSGHAPPVRAVASASETIREYNILLITINGQVQWTFDFL